MSGADGGRGSASSFRFLKPLVSPWAALAILLSAAITLGVHRAPSDLAGTVFTANATLVALIVPAAALANVLLEGRMLSYVQQLGNLPANADPTKAAEALAELADEVIDATGPLVQGFTFLLLSFGLSIAALFHPNHHIWAGHGSFKVNPEDMLLGGALGFDVVAILRFLPFVWLLLDQKLAGQVRDLIKDYASTVGQPRGNSGAVEASAPSAQPGSAGSSPTGAGDPAA